MNSKRERKWEGKRRKSPIEKRWKQKLSKTLPGEGGESSTQTQHERKSMRGSTGEKNSTRKKEKKDKKTGKGRIGEDQKKK